MTSTIVHQKQPSSVSCGQTCVAMLLGQPASEVIGVIGNQPTTAVMLCTYLEQHGWTTSGRCRRNDNKLPSTALCRVRWGSKPNDRRAHWVVWADGCWWDPLVFGTPLFLKHGGRVLSYVKVERSQ